MRELGRRCQIGANVVIAAGVVIGDDCRIGANVTLSHCLIGSRVVLHPGCGSARPGSVLRPTRPVRSRFRKLGRVVIGDDVDIGANTTIDRGSGRDTVIGSGSMIDNLVQIGHNVVLGRCCILAGQVGISGSTNTRRLRHGRRSRRARRPSPYRERSAYRRQERAHARRCGRPNGMRQPGGSARLSS